MTEHYDFTISETKDDYSECVRKKVMRVYTQREQPCDSLHMNSPVNPDGKKEITIRYSIFESVFRIEEETPDDETCKHWILFESGRDENSVLFGNKLAQSILDLAVHNESGERDLRPADNGVEWNVKKSVQDSGSVPLKTIFEFSVFDCDGLGYRFALSQSGAIQFANFLERVVKEIDEEA